MLRYLAFSLLMFLNGCYACTSNLFSESNLHCQGEACAIDYNGAKNLILEIPTHIKKLSISYNGSGQVVLHKSGAHLENLDLQCIGSAIVDLRGVPAKKAKIKYRGSADLKLNASEIIDIDYRGSGDVEIEGGAKINKQGNGSGKIITSW